MKVLVIEDELNIANVITKYLQKENFEVIVSDNGAKGLQLFYSTNPDFIILDIMLPDMDGFIICQKIRETSQVPLIFLTAKRHITDKLNGLQLGADDYISKPFSPRELIARIYTILRRYSPPLDNNDLLVEKNKTGLWFNYHAKQFYINDYAIELTKSEFELLHTLYMSPNTIFSRNELLEIVSGDHYSIERCIDFHIRNIRKKLCSDTKEHNYIKTVFGHGYKYIGGTN